MTLLILDVSCHPWSYATLSNRMQFDVEEMLPDNVNLIPEMLKNTQMETAFDNKPMVGMWGKFKTYTSYTYFNCKALKWAWVKFCNNQRRNVGISSSLNEDVIFYILYRVFIQYCVFFQEFSKVCHLSLASTRLLLVVQKTTSL